MQVDADIFLNRYLAFLKVLFSYFTTEDGKLLTLGIIVHASSYVYQSNDLICLALFAGAQNS